MFSPQHFVFGSPFLLSLSAYTCNAGTHDFYPPLSTGQLFSLLYQVPLVGFPKKSFFGDGFSASNYRLAKKYSRDVEAATLRRIHLR